MLHTFKNGSDGADPLGGLIADGNGNLYGTTSTGGANNGGTVFELTPSNGGWTFNVLYGLTGNPRSQTGPKGLLAIDGSGNLYGVTNSEGANSAGNLFKLTPNGGGNWTYTDLHDFAISSSNGAFPEDGPTLDANGDLYGMTLQGTGTCSYGCGVIYELTQ